MAYGRHQYKGNVSSTDKLATGIGTSDTAFALQDGTTFPDGTVGTFVITIDQGNANEEKCLVTTRSGATLNSVTRGYDGTSAAAHSSGASVLHTISAVDMDEANQAVHNTLGTITTAGDILFAATSSTMSRLGVGTANQLLTSSGTAPQWSSIDGTAADITNSAVGDTAAAGAVGKVADAGHRHGRESFATPAIVLGTAGAAGVATTPIRSDSTIAAFDATAPTTSAVGDAAAVGSAAVAARRDHTHGREAFATPVAVASSGNAAGSATTVTRSDHVHQGPGTLGSATVTADQGSITTLADLTSLSSTVTVGTGRRIKITAQCQFLSTTTADIGTLVIAEGATILAQCNVTANQLTAVCVVYLTPTAGSHTYKLQAARSGVGTLTMQAGANHPAILLVEDIGT